MMQIRKIKSWKEASKTASADANEAYHVCENSIFGISKRSGSWGSMVEGYEEDGFFYANDGFAYPDCVTEEYDGCDDSVYDDIVDYILCHGEIIIADEMLTDANLYVHIRLIAFDGKLYYYKTVSGEVVECKIVGMSYV